MTAQPDRILVQVRLPKALVKEADHMAVDADVWRAEMWERLLRLGIERHARECPDAH